MKYCIVCDKYYNPNPLWALYKSYLNITEKSKLWENCCSAKCYEKLLVKLVDGHWKIENHNGKAMLVGWRETSETG